MELADLQKRVYNLLRKIPKGKITTYKILAKSASWRTKNWRQIGKILSQNQYPQKFPCYKVIKSNGEIGGYNCGKIAKKKALQKDGIIVINNKIKDFKKHLFNNF